MKYEGSLGVAAGIPQPGNFDHHQDPQEPSIVHVTMKY